MLLTNKEVYEITKTKELSFYINSLQEKFIAKIIRSPDESQNKMLLFNNDKNSKRGRKNPNLLTQILENRNQTQEEFCRDAIENKI